MATNPSRSLKDQTKAILYSETLELLNKVLHRLPLLTDTASRSIRRQLDDEGAKLWNICVQRMRSINGHDDTVLLSRVKALAYAMLDAAAPNTGPGNDRSLRLAFKVTKVCIGHGLVDLSQKMMESAATRLDNLEKSESITHNLDLDSFTTEYYMLRIYLAWSQERPDIADHLFSKIPEIKTKEQQRVVLDICYAIGNLALSSIKYESATMWLDRALTVCESCPHGEGQEPDRGLKDKKLLILHVFARANLHLATAASEGQLGRALDLLKAEYGDSFPVVLIQLEVLSKKGAVGEEYLETIKFAIQVMNDDEASVKTVYHYVMKLGSSSQEPFVDTCGQLLDKLVSSTIGTKELWMERIFVSIIWTLTNTPSGKDHCPTLAEAAAHKMTGYGLSELSEGATNGSLILIWKYIDTMLAKESISVAKQWCRFVLKQTVFKKTPDTEAKFFRKLILCFLEKSDASASPMIFDEVPKSCKTCPLTLYLMFRLTLLADDTSLATANLQSLCMAGADATYIWSCIADALQLGKTDITLRSLQGLIAVSDDNGFERMQILQLLQYVICVVCEESITASAGYRLEYVVSLFDSGLEAAGRELKLFTPSNFHWFSCKSYSIAFKLRKSSSSQTVIKLLEISMKFTELYQKEPREDPDARLSEHSLRCTFLQTTIILTEARREKSSTKKATHYKKAHEVINQFQTHIQSLDLDPTQQNWLDKYRIILSFDFEATLFLRQWSTLSTIIEKSKPIVDAKLSSVFLDCLLRSGAPSSYLSQFVKQIIRTFHTSPSPSLASSNFSSLTLPRHLHCLFSLATQAEEYILAESVLDQALLLAQPNTKHQTQSQSKSENQYQKEELQWLATLSFNRAVEYFLMSADEDCRRWAGKAIALADLVGGDDRGDLGRLLRGKFEGMMS
ncbi:meiosis protein SPO22/ZIP4 like-domain-containing protein [Aspergillus cavernicola]|uniref:Meiosis protein SPO22/ZIP4 like-domain-containing protein n=1 Tax=Aspergillus cavernicola TaxID=176166 RepID=A0ABR4IZ30_9EURO